MTDFLIALTIALAIAVCLGVATLFAAGTGIWVFGPAPKGAQRAEVPFRYSLGDFLWLLVMLQVAIAGAVGLAREDLPWLRGTLGFIFAAFAATFWASSIDWLTRSGVTQPLRRGVFTVLVQPAIFCFLVITWLAAAAALPLLLVAVSKKQPRILLAYLGAALLWRGAAWGLQQMVRWVRPDGCPSDDEPSEADPHQNPPSPAAAAGPESEQSPRGSR